MKIADYNVQLLPAGEERSLYDIFGDKKFVIDFWTTKCVKCPAALGKLSEEASQAKNSGADVVYVACVLDSKDVAADIVEETEEWASLLHVFMDFETKEKLKSEFGFSEVPFCIVGACDKEILGSGNPKDMNIPKLLNQSDLTKGALDNNIFSNDDF